MTTLHRHTRNNDSNTDNTMMELATPSMITIMVTITRPRDRDNGTGNNNANTNGSTKANIGDLNNNYTNGNKIEGSYLRSKRNGPYRLTFRNGIVMEAYGINDKRHGKALFSKTNGDISDVTYVEGVK